MNQYADWIEHGRENRWKMPPASWLARLPVIRHLRALWAIYCVERWYYAASIGIRSGYDEWVIYGIAHGLEPLDIVVKDVIANADKRADDARVLFCENLDKWLKIIDAGVSGYQDEAYLVIDGAMYELVNRRYEEMDR